jgi:hypothetical protein
MVKQSLVPGTSSPQGDFEIKDGVLVKYRGKAKDVRVPDGITGIGKWAFSGCESLSSITLPVSLTTIGDGAFSLCKSLGSIILPAGLTSIKNGIFYGCGSLVSIIAQALQPPALHSLWLPQFAPPAVIIYVPPAALEDYKNAEGWKNHTDRIQPLQIPLDQLLIPAILSYPPKY